MKIIFNSREVYKQFPLNLIVEDKDRIEKLKKIYYLLLKFQDETIEKIYNYDFVKYACDAMDENMEQQLGYIIMVIDALKRMEEKINNMEDISNIVYQVAIDVARNHQDFINKVSHYIEMRDPIDHKEAESYYSRLAYREGDIYETILKYHYPLEIAEFFPGMHTKPWNTNYGHYNIYYKNANFQADKVMLMINHPKG